MSMKIDTSHSKYRITISPLLICIEPINDEDTSARPPTYSVGGRVDTAIHCSNGVSVMEAEPLDLIKWIPPSS